jgi:hypothetical protein
MQEIPLGRIMLDLYHKSAYGVKYRGSQMRVKPWIALIR